MTDRIDVETRNPGEVAKRGDLFTRLKAIRARLSAESGTPENHIAADFTLLEMERIRPATIAEMLSVHGIGPKRLRLYGRQFLVECIAATIRKPHRSRGRIGPP